MATGLAGEATEEGGIMKAIGGEGVWVLNGGKWGEGGHGDVKWKV